MSKEYCEKVRLSAMAISDGEQAQLPESDINKHLLTCNECRKVVEQLQSTSKMFEDKKRKSYEINILDEIQPAFLKTKISQERSWHSISFIILGFLLFILKLIDVSPFLTAEVIVKFVAIFVVMVFFVLIRQNPFTINQNL